MPPRLFPAGLKVEIPQQKSVAQSLKKQNVITSTFLFNALARISGADKKLKSGRYIFERALPMPAVLWRIARGDYGAKVIKVTIPEGSTNLDISKLVGVDLGEAGQGYLFPDTYYFDQFVTADEIRAKMHANFDAKVSTSTKDIVTLASIVEAEAASTNDRRIVSGILLKRLKIGMPLQVDVATSTYDYTGLPSAPINNPGLDAIDAALKPTDSPYLYYISDHSGVMHYARTFTEHKANRERFGI